MESKSDTPSQKPKIQPLTIIFFGRTGAGKSYNANRISGNKNLFKEGHNLESQTFEFQMEYCYFEGNTAIPIRIIDTPGFEDNKGLKLSQIYKMFINFVFKYQIEFHMIIYCLKLDHRVPQNELEHLKRLISFVGPKGLRNTYIMLTQLDAMNPSIVEDMVQKYQDQLHGIILKEIPDFDTRNILIPDLNSLKSWKDTLKKLVSSYLNLQPKERFLEVFYFRLRQCQGIEIRFDEENFLSVSDPSTRDLLHLMKAEANKDIHDIKDKDQKKKLEELITLIEIIEGDQNQKFARITKFGISCSNAYLKELSRYFLTDNMTCKNTLINDIYQILANFNKNDPETRFVRSNYAKVLAEELKNKIVPKIYDSIKRIIETTKPARHSKFRTSAGNLSKIKDDTPEAVVSGAATGVLGGTIASQITYVALFEGTTFFSWGMPAGYAIAEAGATSVGTISMLGAAAATGIGLAIAAVGTITYIGTWKRETLVQEITTQAHQKFMEDQKTQKMSLFKGLIQEACFLYLFSE